MKESTKLLTPEQKAAVECAIEAAERETSAEIVVAVRSVSGQYHRAQDMIGIIAAVSAVGAAAVMWPASGDELWNPSTYIGLHPGVVIGIFVVFTVLGAAMAAIFPALTKPLVRRKQREEDVKRAGTEAFHALRIGDASHARGVLLYVSLFEHMVWVAGDERINEKLSHDDWSAIRDRLIAGFRTGDPAAGLVEAITMCGTLLSEPFPLDGVPTNELPNTLHLLD